MRSNAPWPCGWHPTLWPGGLDKPQWASANSQPQAANSSGPPQAAAYNSQPQAAGRGRRKGRNERRRKGRRGEGGTGGSGGVRPVWRKNKEGRSGEGEPQAVNSQPQAASGQPQAANHASLHTHSHVTPRNPRGGLDVVRRLCTWMNLVEIKAVFKTWSNVAVAIDRQPWREIEGTFQGHTTYEIQFWVVIGVA